MADQHLTRDEEWRPVPGFEGRYEVSSLGRVRSFIEWRDAKEVRLLRLTTDKKGYQKVALYNGGRKRHDLKVHAIVAEAFLGPRAPGLTVNHKDLDKKNNCPENLEYVTASENSDHWRRSASLVGSTDSARVSPGNYVLSESDVRAIHQLLSEGVAQGEIARRFGIHRVSVCDIKLRRTWGHLTPVVTIPDYGKPTPHRVSAFRSAKVRWG
jgi:hypothetical protein